MPRRTTCNDKHQSRSEGLPRSSRTSSAAQSAHTQTAARQARRESTQREQTAPAFYRGCPAGEREQPSGQARPAGPAPGKACVCKLCSGRRMAFWVKHQHPSGGSPNLRTQGVGDFASEVTRARRAPARRADGGPRDWSPQGYLGLASPRPRAPAPACNHPFLGVALLSNERLVRTVLLTPTQHARTGGATRSCWVQFLEKRKTFFHDVL